MSFTEVADRVWVARYEWFDVNVTLVAGDRGLLAVDTHGSAVAAREVIDDIRRLGVGEVVAVVNTHEHFDHTFGNGEFRTAFGAVPIHAHETAAEQTRAGRSSATQASYAERPPTTRTATRSWPPRSCRPTTRSPPRRCWTSATGWWS